MGVPREVCARCGRFAPTRVIKVLRGIPLGPECYKLVKVREYIRANGPNPKMLSDARGNFHTTSDFGKLCPNSKDHCLQCSLFKTLCPVEEQYRDQFPNILKLVN